MRFCDNSDHDGEPVPATAVIIMDETSTATARCTYCAEGFTTALVRLGADFHVRATVHEPAGWESDRG